MKSELFSSLKNDKNMGDSSDLTAHLYIDLALLKRSAIL